MGLAEQKYPGKPWKYLLSITSAACAPWRLWGRPSSSARATAPSPQGAVGARTLDPYGTKQAPPDCAHALAAYQATGHDPESDAEPGKTLHFAHD
jgi:hypothetical protein